MTNIEDKLSKLSFKDVDPYDFAKILFEECNEQSFFEPITNKIPEHVYVKLLQWFTNYEELQPLVDQQFFEYMRQKVLEANGFQLELGDSVNEQGIPDIKKFLYD